MILRSFCLAVSLLCASVAAAQTLEASGDVSDKTLKTLKALAWQSLPSRITQSDKIVVEIDKSDPLKIVIPDADAREIIREAHLTARARKCELQDLVIANRDALLLREKKTGRWTEKPASVHQHPAPFTVQLLLGKVEDVDAKSNAAVPSPVVCNEKEKREISSAVEANERLLGKS